MNQAERLTLVARVVHETIRAYQAALGEAVSPPWEESGWMQASSREAVEFAMKNPTPGAQHEAWVQSKQRGGWTYGAVKDESKKTHPSLVPFDQLSEAEQKKDALVIAVVQALAPIVGLVT